MPSTLRSILAWALLVGIVLTILPVALVFAGLTHRRDPTRDRFRRFVASWISVYGWAGPLYAFEVHGRHHLPQEGPYVLIANHESGLDGLSLLMLRTPARFLANDWMFRAWWCGWGLRLCRHIPVRPSNSESRKQAIASAEVALREGSPVAIFPEGRYYAEGLGPFKNGAFVAAKQTNVPIVPVRIEGTGRAWAPGSFLVHGRHKISIRILEPLSREQVHAMELDTLIAESRDRLSAASSADDLRS